MTYKLTVTDTTTTLAVTESPVLITEQVTGIQGLKGDTGSTGATGAKGDKGDTGNTGATGATGQGYTARGVYAGGTAYVPYDVVFFGGNSYRCKANTTGNTPTNTTYWEYLTLGYSAQGAYSSGTTYNQGDTVSFNGGSYYCFNNGTTGITPTNTTYWQVIGAKGDTGSTGPTGPMGVSYAQQVTSTVTGNGTTQAPMFPSGSQAITLAADTAYYFEAYVHIARAASAGSSAVVGLSFSQTQQNLYWQGTATSVSGTGATFQGSLSGTGTTLTLGTSNTGTNQLHIRYSGFFESNATTGGTLTPTFAQNATPSSGNPSVQAGSYFRLIPYSSAYPIISGTWS